MEQIREGDVVHVIVDSCLSILMEFEELNTILFHVSYDFISLFYWLGCS